MIKNAMAYNKTLTEEYLGKLSFNTLLAFTHPIEREGFLSEGRKLMEAPYGATP